MDFNCQVGAVCGRLARHDPTRGETMTAAERFSEALTNEQPLQIAGAINAYCALLAEHSGFRAIYLSGGGVANWSYGLPDLGMTSMNDVLEDVRRITYVTDMPLLV